MVTDSPIILGSRSPRRLELLRLIVPAERIVVVPPADADEPGFEHAGDCPAIENQLIQIARMKSDDVVRQLEAKGFAAVIAADTVIVANEADRSPVVLGQPPETDDWPDVVRDWFERYLLGRDHTAASAVCVATADGRRVERVVTTRVRFEAAAKRWLEWYLRTGEPCGKAGGYAIQGVGGLFASEITGSLSNVVGLPLRELLEMLEELGIVER